MLREAISKKHIGARDGFVWRGSEITRFEGLSDAVFGFAVTLLIVSLEVPATFSQLLITMRGFFAFAICFFLLMSVWYQQYIYFRRYGLQDFYTIFVNSVLLFVILFYIYPLKFLFTVLVNSAIGMPYDVVLPGGSGQPIMSASQMPQLMLVFDAGYIAIFAVFILLFYHAYRCRVDLELNAIEIFDTRASIFSSCFNLFVGLASVALVFLASPRLASLAGLIYPLLLMPGLTISGTVMGRKRRRIMELTRAAVTAE